MIPLTLAEIARTVGGTVHGAADPGPTVTGPVVIDSREVTAGALFAAIVGARSDGHDFARSGVRRRRECSAGLPARRRAVRGGGQRGHRADQAGRVSSGAG